VPGVNREALSTHLPAEPVAGLLNLLSGGALQQLLGDGHGRLPVHHRIHYRAVADPDHSGVQALQKEGEAGRNRLNQYTNWLTIPLALLQAFGQSSLLGQATGGRAGAHAVWLPATRWRRSSSCSR
jgi:preprotein translocase subunit SecY